LTPVDGNLQLPIVGKLLQLRFRLSPTILRQGEDGVSELYSAQVQLGHAVDIESKVAHEFVKTGAEGLKQVLSGVALDDDAVNDIVDGSLPLEHLVTRVSQRAKEAPRTRQQGILAVLPHFGKGIGELLGELDNLERNHGGFGLAIAAAALLDDRRLIAWYRSFLCYQFGVRGRTRLSSLFSLRNEVGIRQR
jgi:hypothetical protein